MRLYSLCQSLLVVLLSLLNLLHPRNYLNKHSAIRIKMILDTCSNYLLDRSIQNDVDLIFCISLDDHVNVLGLAHVSVAKSKTSHITQLYLRIAWNGLGKLFNLRPTKSRYDTYKTTQSSLFSLVTYISWYESTRNIASYELISENDVRNILVIISTHFAIQRLPM